MIERGIQRGHAVCIKDGAEYIGTGTYAGVPTVYRVAFNGTVDGRPSVTVTVEDAPVDPDEPMPDWMREEREKLGLVTPARRLPGRLVDDPMPF